MSKRTDRVWIVEVLEGKTWVVDWTIPMLQRRKDADHSVRHVRRLYPESKFRVVEYVRASRRQQDQ